MLHTNTCGMQLKQYLGDTIFNAYVRKEEIFLKINYLSQKVRKRMQNKSKERRKEANRTEINKIRTKLSKQNRN